MPSDPGILDITNLEVWKVIRYNWKIIAMYLVFLVIIVTVVATASLTLSSDSSVLSDLIVSDKKYQQKLNNTLDSVVTTKMMQEKYNGIINQMANSLKEIENMKKEIRKAMKTSSLKQDFTAGFPKLHTSCLQIQQQDSTNKSGYYFIKSSSGQMLSVYCKMDDCGTDKGPWMRVAKLNTSSCPRGLKPMLAEGGIKSCVPARDGPGCTMLNYSSLGIPYSKVCGRITGYEVGTPDGFYHRGQDVTLMENYLDGVSVTSNGKYVWTLVAGNCKCPPTTFRIPTFVPKDKFICTHGKYGCYQQGLFCTKYFLWGGQQCGSPIRRNWFNNEVPRTTADVNIRVCRDQDREHEDIALRSMTIYVQ